MRTSLMSFKNGLTHLTITNDKRHKSNNIKVIDLFKMNQEEILRKNLLGLQQKYMCTSWIMIVKRKKKTEQRDVG